MNTTTAAPFIGRRISVLRISMSSGRCSSSPELGSCSRIRQVLDPEVGHNSGQIFVNQLRLAPSLAPHPAHPDIDAAEIRKVKREEKPHPTGCHDHHRGNRHQRAERPIVGAHQPGQLTLSRYVKPPYSHLL